MDLSFLRRFAPLYVSAAGLTARIAALGIAGAATVGALCALARYERVPLLRGVAKAYVELARNTPLLVQLYFLYFGLPKLGLCWSAEVCAVVGLTFLGGGYMAEALRSALETVERVQIESAQSLGMTRTQTLRRIIAPQALARAVPSLCANVIFLIKETSVVSAIALADLMFLAKDLIGQYYRTDEALILLVAAYLALLLPVSAAAALLERRLRHAGFCD